MPPWAEREAYRINKSLTLLQPALADLDSDSASSQNPRDAQRWAELGSGQGVVTSALYHLLGTENEIIAVDKDKRALQRLLDNFAESYPAANIRAMPADFNRPLALPPLDGIVMANSLHYVRRKVPVLAQIVALLKPGGRLIVIEYNAARGNYAVPHPLDETGFLEIARQVGLTAPRIATKVPSRFLGEMYTGVGFAPE